MPPVGRRGPTSSQKRVPTVESSSSGESTSEEEENARSRTKRKATSNRSSQGTGSQGSRKASSRTGFSSQGSSSGSQGDLAPALNARLTADMVKYLLIANQKKSAIKRADIAKGVMQEFPKHFNVVFSKAKEKLQQVFGLEVRELEKKGQYILVNQIDVNVDSNHLSWPKEDNARFGLLMVILTIIFMNGNRIPENDLWAALKKLSIEKEAISEEFGDANKVITKEFVRNLYLEHIRIPDSDPPVYEFEWGPRAVAEVNKKDLLDFVCQIYGNVKPDDWLSQYQEAYPATEDAT